MEKVEQTMYNTFRKGENNIAKKYRTSSLGKLLSYVPKNIKLLYPFYLAGTLSLKEDVFYSKAVTKRYR